METTEKGRKEVKSMIDSDRYPHGIVEIDPTTAH
jgi:hypothetical protein